MRDGSKSVGSLIVCSKTNVVLDGHHRLAVLKKLGMREIPALFINYEHDDIVVNPNKDITKYEVI